MKYAEEEKNLLDTLETERMESIPVDDNAIKAMASETLDYLDEEKQISLNRADLDRDNYPSFTSYCSRPIW